MEHATQSTAAPADTHHGVDDGANDKHQQYQCRSPEAGRITWRGCKLRMGESWESGLRVTVFCDVDAGGETDVFSIAVPSRLCLNTSEQDLKFGEAEIRVGRRDEQPTFPKLKFTDISKLSLKMTEESMGVLRGEGERGVDDGGEGVCSEQSHSFTPPSPIPSSPHPSPSESAN
ncbi:hypothetical protein NQZ68_033455 [Dissostichus eleginoides]|nr:hypothetical protein NQZ68_033455 [Dissostichus eleginoides]